jgi:hypothetical protein
MELHIYSPNTPSWRGAQLKKNHRDHFTLLYVSLKGVEEDPQKMVTWSFGLKFMYNYT